MYICGMKKPKQAVRLELRATDVDQSIKDRVGEVAAENERTESGQLKVIVKEWLEGYDKKKK